LTPRIFEKKYFPVYTDQLILSNDIKIIKIAPTSCQILGLKCTKFDFGWVSAPVPVGELTAQRSPNPLAGFKGASSKCGPHMILTPQSENSFRAPADRPMYVHLPVKLNWLK